MGTFNSLIDAKFSPPRNWILDTPLKFNSEELCDEGQKLFKKCGVQITKANVITAPKGYVTDFASIPRFCWGFIAPFDIARAAVIHDVLYEKVNGAFERDKITKQQKKIARKYADYTFREAMRSAEPEVPCWKIWCAFNAVRLFGWAAIKNSVPRKLDSDVMDKYKNSES